MPYENYLVHYGIKGQKWGIRRFQNKDGSLTLEGKERYYSDKNNPSEGKKDNSDKVKKFLIGAGVVTLAAVGGYVAYKSRLNLGDLSKMKAPSALFEKAASHEKDPKLISRLRDDFKKNVEPTLSQKEKDAIRSYTKDDYSNINHLLERNNSGQSAYTTKEDNKKRIANLLKPGVKERCEEEIKTISDALDRTSTKEDIVVNRKTQFSYVKGMFGEDMSAKELANILSNPKEAVGRVLTSKGFCSASVDPSTNATFGSCNLHIAVPKGSKGMFISSLSNSPKETEFLMQKGSKFKLVDVKQFSPDSESLYFSPVELFLELIK